ncbi:hypothetical protein ACJBUE_24840 (plasmid) [Ralstonia syzygii subsp. celebesensis]|uniref:hypothetical protein n=2 Tax=Ralstonia syzygii TaxID=28097 RepID=UPI001F1CE083|nr:hypothetical protein [Ralstonia syzygii]
MLALAQRMLLVMTGLRRSIVTGSIIEIAKPGGGLEPLAAGLIGNPFPWHRKTGLGIRNRFRPV